jgi:hypothetical protein
MIYTVKLDCKGQGRPGAGAYMEVHRSGAKRPMPKPGVLAGYKAPAKGQAHQPGVSAGRAARAGAAACYTDRRSPRRSSIRTRLAAIMLVAFVMAAWAQQAAPRTAVVLTAANLSRDGADDSYRKLITDALAVETANAGFRLIAPAVWEAQRVRLGVTAADLALGPAAIALGRAVGAEVAATGSYRVDDNRITIDLKFYNVAQERLIASVVTDGRTGLAVLNLINDAVLEVVSLLAQPLAPLPAAVVSRDDQVREITLVSRDEGAEILVGGRPAAAVQDGKAVLKSIGEAPDVTVEIRKDGYQPRSERVALQETGSATLKPLWPASKWAAELSSTTGQLIGGGIGLRRYVLPDSVFVSADNYLYFQTSFTEQASTVVHDDQRFLVGTYLFFGPYSRFRVGIAAGFGAIATFFTDSSSAGAFDIYVNPASVWLEWNAPRWSVFWRTEGKYALGVSTGLLEKRWVDIPQMGPPQSVGVLYKW